MPELPEVETVRRTLEQLIVGKTVDGIEVLYSPLIKRPLDDPETFRETLRSETIQAIKRRGKFLIFETDRLSLVSHLRMEGRYALKTKDDLPDKHTHVIFRFTDGTALHYRDVRKFGTFHLFSRGEEMQSAPLLPLGPEPLDPGFTLDAFIRMLRGKTTKLKPLLLDQHFLAGLGNIYVDEALFRACLHPERPANTLTRKQKTALYESIVETLQKAVDSGGSSVRSYLNGKGEMGMFQLQIQVYGRQGESCPNCHSPIRKKKVGGRGTHYCPKCQPQPRRRSGSAVRKSM
jgi:formamidopyrimidine-DNA glycosylase